MHLFNALLWRLFLLLLRSAAFHPDVVCDLERMSLDGLISDY